MSEANNEKWALVPRLRFPEFRGAEKWKSAQLDQLISTVAPPKKIPTTEYLSEGKFPILDQGQDAIAGWTNDPDFLVEVDKPLIIFGDHTCALKLAQQPFAQGADGIKIIKAGEHVVTNYLYQFLCFHPVVTEEYKRHFSILKTRWISYPERGSGEQQKIADCLSSRDELITVETQKLDTLKAHKKGLMQQLFPREGEAIPRLRFPDFRDDPRWIPAKLGDVSSIQSGGTPARSNAVYWGGDIPWVTTSLIDWNTIIEAEEYITKAGLEESSAKVFPRGTVLMAMYGQGKTRGKVAMLDIDAATNQACSAIIIREKRIKAGFVFQNLASRYEEIRKISNSGGQENLSAELIEDIYFSYPENEKEQETIIDVLSSLDNLITAQGQRIDALRIHKKGLMQQLFPVLDEVHA